MSESSSPDRARRVAVWVVRVLAVLILLYALAPVYAVEVWKAWQAQVAPYYQKR